MPDNLDPVAAYQQSFGEVKQTAAKVTALVAAVQKINDALREWGKLVIDGC